MTSVLWDEKGIMCLKFLPKEVTGTCCYVKTLGSLNACLHQLHLTRKVSEMSLFPDNARPLISVHTTEAITKFWLTLLLHLLYNHTRQPHTIRFFTFLVLCRPAHEATVYEQQGSAEHHAPVFAEGEQLCE
jgi:hypothetical protein